MEWRIIAQTWNDSADSFEVRAATSRSFVARLRSPSTAQFTMNGEHAQAAMLTELVTDIFITCRHPSENSGLPVTCFRGRLGNTQDTIGETVHSVAYQFGDYRAVLDRRLADADSVITGVEQATIAINLIDEQEAQTNGSLGIAAAVGNATGQLKQLTVKTGDSVMSSIDSLARRENGFDWDILPDTLEFKIWYPARGEDNDENLEYGKTVETVTRSRTPGSFSNVDYISGGEGTIPIVKSSATIATDPRGRWESSFTFPSVTVQTTLDQHGNDLIEDTSVIRGSYNVRLKSGWWRGPGHLWLGDTVIATIRKGRVNESMDMHIFEVSVDIDDDGEEVVRMVLVP